MYVLKTIVLLLACLCSLSSYAQISDAEFIANEQASVIKLAKYIQDTASFQVQHSDKWGTVEGGEDSINYYFFNYSKSGYLKSIQIDLNKGRKQHYFYFDDKGKLEHEEHTEPSPKSNFVVFVTKAIYYHPSGRIRSISVYPGDKRDVSSFYREDDGTLEEIANYKNDKADGKREVFYRSGKVKTVYHYINGKIDTVEEFEENGNKVAATKVENGNGYYLGCSPSGGFCCECYVVKGKLVNCKNLEPPKSIEKKM